MCGALVFAEELKRLAEAASHASSPLEELACWRRVHALLPAGSQQQQAVVAKIDALVRIAERGPAGAAAKSKSGWGKAAGGAGVGVALLTFFVTKGKLLLLGLANMTTLLSMFVSFGAYLSIWSWKFVVGLLLSIYVHEMGHVAMLARLGIKATAPMFIPGFGAYIRSRETLATVREEALVGLAGPNWGLGAALACWALGYAFSSPLFAALAHIGAVINLFNLTPVWQLDGSHAWRALTQWERYIITGTVAAALFLGGPTVSILWLVLICAVARLFQKDAAPTPDGRTLADFAILVATLTFICTMTAR